MIYEVIWTIRFKKSYKQCQKRGIPLQGLKDLVKLLRTDHILDVKCHNHKLIGEF